ncbi:MAG: class I SAM-dependent methyltransferase [Hyphomicrobiaceae bacterium]
MTGEENARQRMDGIYRHQRHVYDLTRKLFLLGRDHLIEDLRPPPDATILEIGCGTGRNLIFAARQYPQIRLYGLDVSPMMLETAEEKILGLGFSQRIALSLGDATNFSPENLFGAPYFDRVFFSYAVSMIPNWQFALSQAYKVVRPGGSLHVVDFGQQDDLPSWFKRGVEIWLGKFSVTPQAALYDLMRELATVDGGRVRFATLYRDYVRYAVIEKPLADDVVAA